MATSYAGQKAKDLPYIPDMAESIESADHIDFKTAESDKSLREFLAGFLSYQPAWITALYYVRWGFVRLLGMKQEGIPKSPHLRPENVPMTAGEGGKISIFEVVAAEEDHYWFGQAAESHLTATLGVICEALPDGKNRFYVVTLVHYNKWTGRVYFNTIRPFHHLVVGGMLANALKG